ncbi:bleomycin resistance protein [Cypionkella aquatica]|uniref:Bleomycin resistance protein n=1 Tax=Cypionkella aquatica TaxID=1756042 RepID=A0AA37TUQ0_9RHOB|nr:VOC family protein [Cypionkella aquatica]GLS88027.1 bleomycin resistance protein [Cypionkella aquatica]
MSTHGLPCWYELASNDIDSAKAFYAKILGWNWADSGMPGMTYLLASVDGAMVAGLFAPDPGMPVAWTSYTAVDDADATAEKAKALGATVVVPPTDIPGTGRFSVLIDPQGAVFGILQPQPMADGTAGDAFNQQKSGHGNWHDLATPDTAAALAFYGALFGWAQTRAMPMGPDMVYTVINRDGQDIGGIFNEAGSGGPAAWTVYFGTASVNAAVEAVKAAGGQVLHDPAEVPGGALIIHCTDPTGASFALVGPS